MRALPIHLCKTHLLQIVESVVSPQRHSQTDRQTDRQTDKQTERRH